MRGAIELARDIVVDERPLSTARFRTDGRSIFLQVAEEDGETRLVDLFKKQFAFREIIGRSLKDLDYDSFGLPAMWWPMGRGRSIVLDPARSFGQPIEAEMSVPVSTLAAAVWAEGSRDAAAKAWDVPIRAIDRALSFQREMDMRKAA